MYFFDTAHFFSLELFPSAILIHPLPPKVVYLKQTFSFYATGLATTICTEWFISEGSEATVENNTWQTYKWS